MRKFVLISFLLLLSIVAKPQNLYTILHLNENVEYKTKKPKKLIDKYTAYDEFGKISQTKVETFDQAGMPLTVEQFENNNHLTSKIDFVNDTSNHLILKKKTQNYIRIRKSYIPGFFQTATYVYDANHFLIKAIHKDKIGKTIESLNIVNNYKGDPAIINSFLDDGSAYGKETSEYRYDQNRVVTHMMTYNGHINSVDTLLISITKASQLPAKNEKYNAHGDLTNWTVRSENGEEANYEEKYEYDEFGNCISRIIYVIIPVANDTPLEKFKAMHKIEYTY